METIGTITVNVEVERKLCANRVDMHIEIRGESFVSGHSRHDRDLLP